MRMNMRRRLSGCVVERDWGVGVKVKRVGLVVEVVSKDWVDVEFSAV